MGSFGSKQKKEAIKPCATINGINFLSNGRLVTFENQGIRIWDVETNTYFLIPTMTRILYMFVTHDDKIVISDSYNVEIIEPSSGKILHQKLLWHSANNGNHGIIIGETTIKPKNPIIIFIDRTVLFYGAKGYLNFWSFQDDDVKTNKDIMIKCKNLCFDCKMQAYYILSNGNIIVNTALNLQLIDNNLEDVDDNYFSWMPEVDSITHFTVIDDDKIIYITKKLKLIMVNFIKKTILNRIHLVPLGANIDDVTFTSMYCKNHFIYFILHVKTCSQVYVFNAINDNLNHVYSSNTKSLRFIGTLTDSSLLLQYKINTSQFSIIHILDGEITQMSIFDGEMPPIIIKNDQLVIGFDTMRIEIFSIKKKKLDMIKNLGH